ncbi:MAG: hypothetical protein JXB18_01905 [Sedimentisphaerales bacterium]|nr:hypothetical protein [Sedimentisphaerales bacterium]
MMILSSLSTLSTITVLSIILPFSVQPAMAANDSAQRPPTAAKELYLPKKIDRVPDNNDYTSNDSEYSFKRMVQGDNIAIFWSREYGDDPMSNPNAKKRFHPAQSLAECERFYEHYVNELKMVLKGQSLTDRYKMLVIVFGGDGGTAYGGGSDDKIGVLWTPAVRINKKPYGALAHEMAHCFQYISRIDSGHGPGGAIMEMSAQYMLWQVYPEWMTFEHYHLVDFLKQTHYAFLHPINMYHSPYVLEYWSNKHGKEFFGILSRSTEPGEDPVMTYKRLNGLGQDQFNDEMFDACRRFITWDMKRIAAVAKPYANQHSCTLQDIGDGWYRIAPAKCPQNYGYNGIKLTVPAAGTTVGLTFKGIAGAEGYPAVKTDKAGWRYGFVASLKDGSRVYGQTYKDSEGSASFQVPEKTDYLWLVVMGAPTEHWPIAGRRRARTENTAEEQWPYQIQLAGTGLDASVIQSIPSKAEQGK